MIRTIVAPASRSFLVRIRPSPRHDKQRMRANAVFTPRKHSGCVLRSGGAPLFFVISKLVENLLLPSNAVAIVALAGGLLLAFRWRRTGLALLSAAVMLLIVVGWGPL